MIVIGTPTRGGLCLEPCPCPRTGEMTHRCGLPAYHWSLCCSADTCDGCRRLPPGLIYKAHTGGTQDMASDDSD